MKRALIAAVLASTITLGGCIGSFSLTNKLYSWNEKATGNRYVNSGILWVLGWILPVYGVTLFVDAVVLNTIEFWSGKNPMAFSGPKNLEKVVTSNGKTLKITMGNNAITVDRLDGASAGREFALRYDPATSSYFMSDKSGRCTKVGSLDKAVLTLYSPDGKATRQSLEDAPMAFAH